MSRRENKQLDTYVSARRLLFVDRTIGATREWALRRDD